jgi:hypothetical protein
MAAPEIHVHAPMEDDKRSVLTTIAERPSTPYPSHPIPQLQGPFEESIVETTDNSGNDWVVEIDAQTRRRDLLENDEYERLCGRKWRQRESEK